MSVEIKLYYKPLCPFCERVDKLIQKALLIHGLNKYITYSKILVDRDFPFENPLRKIFKCRNYAIHIENIGKGRAKEIFKVPSEDVYASFRHIRTPIVEICVYGRQTVQRIFLLGGYDPRYEKEILANLVSLLRALVLATK